MTRLALLIALLMPVSVFGAEQGEVSYLGTWKGTIGKSKVQVCFTSFESQYYYLRHKQGIFLAKSESNPNEWSEQSRNRQSFETDVTGIWKLNRVEAAEIQGVWVNPGTKAELPISLSRIAPPDANSGCGEAFYAPIVDSIKYKYETGPNGWKTISTGFAHAFELPATTKNAKKINAYVRDWIKQQAIASYECELSGGGGWDEELSVVFQSADWLTVRDNMPDTYCGGAHGSSSTDHHTFDLNTGEIVSVGSWLASGYGDGESKLGQMIEKLNPRTDCVTSPSIGEPYPTASGLVFPTSYAHVERACDDEILISYKDLKPFLSPAGRKAVASITRR